MSDELITTRFVPWFGANSANADVPAKHLAGCSWVYVPFAGSMCEIPEFAAGVQLLVSDLHSDLITLAKIVQDRDQKNELVARLASQIFHPGTLETAKATIARGRGGASLFGGGGDRPSSIEIAEAYFIVAWMGRSAVAGTRGEAGVGLALRFDAGGGDPVTRYNSAVSSLAGWHKALQRCAFTVESCFDVLAKLEAKISAPGFNTAAAGNRIGVYADPPWPDDGDGYLHRFSDSDQRRFAREIAAIPHIRACVRFGDHPLIRELYPAERWEWHLVNGRDQDRKAKAEVFLVRRSA